MTINQISNNFLSGITLLQFTKEIYNMLLLKLVKLKIVSLLLLCMFFNLAKILPMNLEVVIIFTKRTNIQTVHFGSESIKTLVAKIWDLIPAEIKASKSFTIFNKKIKNWTPKSCLCHLYRI